jgi:hypothetical protein
MPNEQFNDIQDFFRQAVMNEYQPWFENNTPTWNFIQDGTEEIPMTEKGWRIPAWTERPGGYGAYIPSAPDFNAAVPPATNSMYVFPTGFSLAAVMDGALIRGLRVGKEQAIISAKENMDWYTQNAAKHLNWIVQGDGSGALAYSSSTLTAGAGQTMNCTTTATTTAGQTKGATRLALNNPYQAINTATGLVRGTIKVTQEGTSSCVVTVVGSVSSGDPIVDVGSYNFWFKGLAWLISGQNRVFQQLNTANFPNLNSPQLDLVNRTQTPADIATLKAMLQTRNNDPKGANGKKGIWTPGRAKDIEKQGYGYFQYVQDKNTMQGVAETYKDGDTSWLEDADADDDRTYLFSTSEIKRLMEMPFGIFDLDSLTMRMQLGANGTGSDSWQMAWGLRGNLCNKLPRAAAVSIRGSISGLTTQVNSFSS